MDLPERWASPECQHSHQLGELRFFLGSRKRGLQGGKVTGHQEGLAQDRHWRLKIGFPRAFPGEFLGQTRGASLECWWKGVVLESTPTHSPSPAPAPFLPSSSSGCRHFTNPTGRGLQIPRSLCGKEKQAMAIDSTAFSFLFQLLPGAHLWRPEALRSP